jgi:hypothetical protein
MKNEFQIKVVMGFNDPNYKKLNSKIGIDKKIKIGYDILPYSIDLFNSDDQTSRRKIDPIYGKINYVNAFLYLDDLVFSASSSVCENKIFHFPSRMTFDVLIGEEV